MPAKKATKTKKSEIKEMTPDELRKLINREFGAGTMKLASDPSLEIVRIPTGILSLDTLLGGGFAKNRHFEMYGDFSVGKTYITLCLIAMAQSLGMRCAFVDVEGSFDPAFAAHIGVDLDELELIPQDEHGPKCVNVVETLLRSKLYEVIIVDSIASLLPKEEYEKDMTAASMGAEQAKMMSKALRKLTAANSNTALVFINQTREKIGVVFGSKTTTPGGRAMRHYAGVRIELVKTETIKRKGDVLNQKTGEIKREDVAKGHRIQIRVEKDKTGGARQGDQSTMVFDYDHSEHDHVEDLIYLGRSFGYVHKSGDNWWVDEYEDEKVKFRPTFKKWLRKNKAVAEELEDWIREGYEYEDEESEEDDE